MSARLLALLAASALCGAAAAAEPGDEAPTTYRIDTAGSTRSARVGGEGRLVVAIEPLAKVHVHPQAPLKITLEAPAGLRLAKTQLGHKDAVDPKAEGPRFEVPFTAVAPGRQEARANLDFFICSDQWCVKQVRTVAIPVDVAK